MDAPGGTSFEASFLSAQAWSTIQRRLHLSAREAQIVCLILCDKTEGAIATDLGISPHTVHTHVERLYRKIDASSHCQVVVRIFQEYVRLGPEPENGEPSTTD